MRPLVLVAVLVAASSASRARAQDAGAADGGVAAGDGGAMLSPDDDAARMHFESGRVYYQSAQYEDAAREFSEAYRLSHRPALLINLSRAWEGLRRFDRAASAMDDYLAVAPPDDPDRQANEERRDRLRATAERDAREHPSDAHHAPPPPHPLPPPPSGLTDTQIAGIVTASSGVLVEAVSLILGAVADSTYQDLRRTCPMGLCPPSRQGDIDSGTALATASTILTAFAIAAAATGLIMLIFGGRQSPPPRAAPAHDDHDHHAAVRVRPWLGGLQLEWGL